MSKTSRPLVNSKVHRRDDLHFQCVECKAFDFKHYEKCSQLRPFPIQGGGAVPWWLAEVAYEHYYEQWPGQSLERMAERGGFGVSEIVGLIRREL